MDRTAQRHQMVDRQIARRGISDPRVLEAMGTVPREAFVERGMEEFAYRDSPLLIGEKQTISQPYIVAMMAQVADIQKGDKLLEIGTGSGYAAAVYSHIADQVYTIERHAALGEYAQQRLEQQGYHKVHCRTGDGTLGWPEAAPFDVVLVAAGGPRPPEALLEQMRVGGRLVMPVGEDQVSQTLVRVVRTDSETFDATDYGPVAFVPLVGAQGWADTQGVVEPPPDPAAMIRLGAEPLPDPVKEHEAFGRLFDRLGSAKVVLLGEASHGTHEFYAARAAITRRLITEHGFTLVAVEADFPDGAWIDRWVRGRETRPQGMNERAFARFPTWMWRNTVMRGFVDWMKAHNDGLDVPAEKKAGFYGLDLYALYTAIGEVLRYLDRVDPPAAAVARERYGCLSPWQRDPTTYGRAVLTRGYETCEGEVTRMLVDIMQRRLEYMEHDGDRYLEAERSAALIRAAEHYYRAMYFRGAESWNLRDRHMFDTLESVLSARGPDAKAVVWAHNSHIGDVRSTEMGMLRGELNLGQLVREHWGDQARLVGFGTDSGTVAAASDWGGSMEIKQVRPSHRHSYERVMTDADAGERFLLDFHRPAAEKARAALSAPRLERAIGVIYRPETERQSHYFEAILAKQFDAYVWFDKTRAVTPIEPGDVKGVPDTYPFGL